MRDRWRVGLSFTRLTASFSFFKFIIMFIQETIKGTERVSPIYTLFHR